MPRDGNGAYSLPLADVVNGTTIEATWANTTLDDLATAMTNSLAKNGETVITGTIDFNGNKLDLDADADTSITADTDDQIDFEVGGSDVMSLTAASLTISTQLNVDNLRIDGNTISAPSTGGITLTPQSGSNVTVPDNNETARRSAWVQIAVSGGASRAFAESDINHVVSAATNSATYTIPSGLGKDADIITLWTSIGATITIAQGSGVTLYWLQGGAYSTGNRSISLASAITLYRNSSTEWLLWGNGIS